MCAHAHAYTCGVEKTVLWCHFSLFSFLWVLEIKLGSPGLLNAFLTKLSCGPFLIFFLKERFCFV